MVQMVLLEKTEHLTLRQAEVVDIRTENGRVSQVVLRTGAVFSIKAVILCTGTFLSGRTIVGECIEDSGPDGMHAAGPLTDALLRLGLPLRRFKTGTPARIDVRSIDFDEMTPQPGDEPVVPFSFLTERQLINTHRCYLTWTTPETHDIIRANLHRAPLYSGKIHGVGPRYCPSIEDKIVKFADKDRHQVFLEPEGAKSREWYVQGMSSSLPEKVQWAMYRTVPGLERAVLVRLAYAIEYDCIDPLQLDHTLALRDVPGLWCAGQLCGSSGYEEAAGQGLIAGINAARWVQDKPPFVLKRRDGYIGTLIDDLVTRGTNEPYRMMTSRSEYRLICRQDNAGSRLMPLGHAIGLISDERLAAMETRQAQIRAEVSRLEKTVAPPNDKTNAFLEAHGTSPIALRGASLADLLRRPQLCYEDLAEIDPAPPSLPRPVTEQVEIEIKYEGYIRRQLKDIEEQRRLEDSPLPPDIDYLSIRTLRTEARQKLQAVRPETLGQAGRISGVSPADVGALMVYLSHREEQPK